VTPIPGVAESPGQLMSSPLANGLTLGDKRAAVGEAWMSPQGPAVTMSGMSSDASAPTTTVFAHDQAGVLAQAAQVAAAETVASMAAIGNAMAAPVAVEAATPVAAAAAAAAPAGRGPPPPGSTSTATAAPVAPGGNAA